MHRSSRLYGPILGAIAFLAQRPLAGQLPTDTTRAAHLNRRAPLAVRDSLTSGVTVTGDVLTRLPVDDVRQLLGLAPGVLFRGNNVGLPTATDFSVRGSLLGDVAVYVDGAPARSELFNQQLSVGAEALDEATLTTGVPDILKTDVRGGVLSYVTRAGDSTSTASLRAVTDEAFGNGSSVGFNRFEAFAGGPLGPEGRRVKGLRWFVSGTLQGQLGQYLGSGVADQPSYVLGGTDTTVQSVAVPRYVLFDQGLRRPDDWSTLKRGQAKVVYAYGAASRLSMTALASDVARRFFPGQALGDPGLYQGARAWSRLAVLDWSHGLAQEEDRGLRLSVNLSYGLDQVVGGLLDPPSELATRDPSLGIEFSTLKFVGTDSIPNPLTEQIIRNIRNNSGLRTPLLNRTDLRNAQPYRLNPYGLLAGWPNQGLDGSLTMGWERRLNGRGSLEWRRGMHRVTTGLDATRTDLSYYNSGLITEIGMDAVLAHPRRSGIFAGDRLTLGRAVVDVGLRYDHFSPGAAFSHVPGRIFTDPAWNSTGGDTAYANSVARVFVNGRGQGLVSPRVRLAYTFGPGTSVRAAFGQQVEPPTFRQLLSNVNSDLSFTSTAQPFGRDVDYAKSTLVELGARQAVSAALAATVAVYHKTAVDPYAYLLHPFDDPSNPGRILNINSLTRLKGNATGIDATLDWRSGEGSNGSVAYSLIRSGLVPWIGVVVVGRTVTQQQLSVVGALRLPSEWRWAVDLEALATLRLTSGIPYPLLVNTGTGLTVPGELSLSAGSVDDTKLPWTKSLDLKVAKGIRAGRFAWTLYADARNLLNFTNHIGAYAETGTDENNLFRANVLAPELGNLATEAQSQPVSKLNADGSIDLGDCTQWTANAASTINCVALQRVEQRFGNGDHVYTVAEQSKALGAYFDAFFGAWRFHGPGRTLRIGLELAF